MVTKRHQQGADMCHVYVRAHGDLLSTLQVGCLFYHPTVIAEWCIALFSKGGFAEQKLNYL